MEAATPLRRPQVRAQGDRLVVDALVVDDACAVRLAREREQAGEDPAELVRDAIEIGARVLDREHAGVQTDFVRAEFERQAREVEQAFTDKARLVAEHFGRKVDEVFSEESGVLSRQLVRHFDAGSSTAVQHQVRTLVDDVMRRAREDLLRQFTTGEGSNPLADFKNAAVRSMQEASTTQERNLRALHAQMAELKQELQGLRDERQRLEEVAAERERGTAKGRSFEEAVAAALDEIATGQGDLCDAVGDARGAGGKTGDVVVEIDGCTLRPRGTIVFEVKNSRLSRPKAVEELDRALEQRSADYAVLVVPSEDQVPAKLQPLREVNGDKLITVFDPEDGGRLGLEVAYKLARARVLMARAGQDGLDPAVIRERVERALGALDEARSAKRELTNAGSAIDKARGYVETLESRVRAHLDEIDGLLAGAEEEPA
jgi:polyhydroxyalkanoate synthesis regulator phasin